MSVVERVGGEGAGRENSVKKVAIASTIGATIEWYDFFLYGTAAGLIFNQLFFPPGNPTAGTLAAYATFAAGFVARPVGGFIFGHFGDRIGRKTMLVLTLLIMGVATFAIGLVPTYAQVGIWAPIILLTLRVLQGIGLGGEWGGAVLMAVEHAPNDQRGLNGSWPQMGVPAGLVLGTGAFALVGAISGEAVWAWRVPFLLSVILIAVGLFIRLHIYESPAFSRVRESGTEARMPIVDVFRTYPKNVLLAVGSRIGIDVVFYIFAVYVLTYVSTNLGLPRNLGLIAISIAALIEIFTIPAFASLSDKVGRRPVLITGAAFLG